MSQIVAFHSSRGGTGKSNISANVASLLALDGQRVGIVATSLQSSGMHALFGLDGCETAYGLNDYLSGCCDISRTAYDVSASLGPGLPGAVFVIPSGGKPGELARLLVGEDDVALLSDGLQRVVRGLQLDMLIIDTHPGLAWETLLFMAVSDALAIVLRPDQQEYEDIGVAVTVARKLGVPHLRLIVNKVPALFDLHQVRTRIERACNCAVAAVLPQSDDLLAPTGAGMFAHRYPEHPVAAALRAVAGVLRHPESGVSASSAAIRLTSSRPAAVSAR